MTKFTPEWNGHTEAPTFVACLIMASSFIFLAALSSYVAPVAMGLLAILTGLALWPNTKLLARGRCLRAYAANLGLLVDRIFLTHNAQLVSHHPESMLAACRLHDSSGVCVASQLAKKMAQAGLLVRGVRVLVLAHTVIEHNPDMRNLRVIDIIREMAGYPVSVEVNDPWVDAGEVDSACGLQLQSAPRIAPYGAMVVAVSKRKHLGDGKATIRAFGRRRGSVHYGLTGVLRKASPGVRPW